MKLLCFFGLHIFKPIKVRTFENPKAKPLVLEKKCMICGLIKARKRKFYTTEDGCLGCDSVWEKKEKYGK